LPPLKSRKDEEKASQPIFHKIKKRKEEEARGILQSGRERMSEFTRKKTNIKR